MMVSQKESRMLLLAHSRRATPWYNIGKCWELPTSHSNCQVATFPHLLSGGSLVKTVVICGCVWLATTLAFAEVTFDWALVGNAGNAGELTGAGAGGFGDDAIVGGVDYEFQISKYEVTNPQYTAFLNAVARTDPNGLFQASMASSPLGGIQRSGAGGNFTYSVKAGRGNNPVIYVSFLSAMRFAN